MDKRESQANKRAPSVGQTRHKLRIGAVVGALGGLLVGLLLHVAFLNDLGEPGWFTLSNLVNVVFWVTLGATVGMTVMGIQAIRGARLEVPERESAVPSPSSSSGSPVLLSFKELQQVVDRGTPTMAEFYSPTCPHCATLEPTIEELAQEWNGRALVAQVDVQAYPSAAKQWTIMGTPTVLLFKEGEEVERLTGVQNAFQYERALERITTVSSEQWKG